MRLVENIQDVQSSVNSVAITHSAVKPRLKLVWKTEIRNGQKRLFGQWIVE